MGKFRHALGPWLVLAISLFPLLIWALMMPLRGRFLNLMTTLTSFGQMAALVGMAMFSLVLIIHARIGFIEGLFGGLDGVYRNHHRFGGIAFILLLFHPLFLAARFVSLSVRDAFLFLLPGADFSVNLGFYALVLLEILLLITFYLRWRYQDWKLSHTFIGLAFFLAGLHVFFIKSDVSRNTSLRIYMLSLAALGIILYIVRKVFRPINRYEYKVEQVRKLSKNVTEISIKPVGKPLKHRAGQFAFVSFKSKQVSKEWHPFTISSAPKEDNIRFSIKNLGDFTGTVSLIKKGDHATLEGPYGRFCAELYPDKPQLWIAGGIGITPFLSMVRSFDSKRPVTLINSVVNEDEAVCLEELKSTSHKNLEFILHDTSKDGYITADRIMRKVKDVADREIFLCGPPTMMRSLKKQFKEFGITKIHSEEFDIR